MELSGADLDNVTRTILGEAGANATPASMAAVASTIRNRLAAGGYGEQTHLILLLGEDKPMAAAPERPARGNAMCARSANSYRAGIAMNWEPSARQRGGNARKR